MIQALAQAPFPKNSSESASAPSAKAAPGKNAVSNCSGASAKEVTVGDEADKDSCDQETDFESVLAQAVSVVAPPPKNIPQTPVIMTGATGDANNDSGAALAVNLQSDAASTQDATSNGAWTAIPTDLNGLPSVDALAALHNSGDLLTNEAAPVEAAEEIPEPVITETPAVAAEQKAPAAALAVDSHLQALIESTTQDHQAPQGEAETPTEPADAHATHEAPASSGSGELKILEESTQSQKIAPKSETEPADPASRREKAQFADALREAGAADRHSSPSRQFMPEISERTKASEPANSNDTAVTGAFSPATAQAQTISSNTESSSTQAPHPVQQVKEAVVTGAAKGLRELEIELKPEGLGTIHLKLSGHLDSIRSGSELRVEIQVSNPEAHALLTQHMDELKSSLSSWDVKVAPHSMKETGTAAGNPSSPGQERHPQDSRRGHAGHAWMREQAGEDGQAFQEALSALAN